MVYFSGLHRAVGGWAVPESRAVRDLVGTTERLRIYIRRRDKDHCIYCGSPWNVQVDHVFPLSKGGPTIKENLVLMCAKCNIQKSDRLYVEQMVAGFGYLHEIGENIDWVNNFYPLNLYSLTEVIDIVLQSMSFRVEYANTHEDIFASDRDFLNNVIAGQ